MDNTTLKEIQALVERYLLADTILSILIIVLGIPLCSWFVWCILCSPEFRPRLRNQLICAVTIGYTLNAVALGILEVYTIQNKVNHHCSVYAFYIYFNLFIEFNCCWMIVILLLLYLAQLLDYDPTLTLTPMVVKIGKGTIFVLPFIFAVILVPSVAASSIPHYINNEAMCMIASFGAYKVLLTLDFFTPMSISIVLLAITSRMYYCRFHRGFGTSSGMRTELVGRGPRVDNVFAYVAVVTVVLAFRLTSSLFYFIFEMIPLIQRVHISLLGHLLMDMRVLFVPFCWLFLEDIRERIKTWRPWYRPASGIDLTVAYNREEENIAQIH